MSASLVGSEMCIRDRSSRALSWKRMSLPWGWERERILAPCSPAPLPPVSYTHLTLPTICSV
eukprot:13034566-Alexandrium_andersonii.AAC.1